jgi:hypothetical protein
MENAKKNMTSPDVTAQRLPINFVFASRSTPMQISVLLEADNMLQVSRAFLIYKFEIRFFLRGRNSELDV